MPTRLSEHADGRGEREERPRAVVDLERHDRRVRGLRRSVVGEEEREALRTGRHVKRDRRGVRADVAVVRDDEVVVGGEEQEIRSRREARAGHRGRCRGTGAHRRRPTVERERADEDHGGAETGVGVLDDDAGISRHRAEIDLHAGVERGHQVRRPVAAPGAAQTRCRAAAPPPRRSWRPPPRPEPFGCGISRSHLSHTMKCRECHLREMTDNRTFGLTAVLTPWAMR